jgi:hypothetical protein
MRRLSSTILGLGIGTMLLTGCPDRQVSKIDPGQNKEEETLLPVSTLRKIDILFVIDNSMSMDEEQASLSANFQNFIDVLSSIEGGLPDVHIGVVSSNVGVGGFNIGGCGGDGDDGKLQNTPRGACTPPNGFFVADEIAADGVTRVKNYSGTLKDAFSCIAVLGVSGCGFEQHFESMKRSLDGSRPENNGFLRSDAFLAIIFIADEDDCSASNPAMFDPADNSLTGTYGPLTSYRCTEFGIQCDQGLLTRTAATYTGCVPRENSPYMYHPQSYVDFVKGLKQDPNLLIVAGIIGNFDSNTVVSVSTDADGEPSLDPSCSTPGTGVAVPGVRLKYFLDQFPNRNTVTSICNSDLSDALTQIAELLKLAIGNPCLQGNIDDTDLSPAPGLQIDCTVEDVQYPNTDLEKSTAMPRCTMSGDTTVDGSSPKPCWWAQKDPGKCSGMQEITDLIINIEREGSAPPGTYARIACAAK